MQSKVEAMINIFCLNFNLWKNKKPRAQGREVSIA